MKRNELIKLLQELPEDAEIFITDSNGLHKMRYNPDISLNKIDDEEVRLYDLEENKEVPQDKTWHIW